MRKLILIIALLLISTLYPQPEGSAVSSQGSSDNIANTLVRRDANGGFSMGALDVNDDASFGGIVTQETYIITKHVAISGAVDNTATDFFTITTTDETGANDGGAYTVEIDITAGEGISKTAVNIGVMSLVAHFARAMTGAGGGTNSGVAEISQSADAAEGSGAISDIVVTVVETSEYVQTIQIAVDTSGQTAEVNALVMITYRAFETPPAIAGI